MSRFWLIFGAWSAYGALMTAVAHSRMALLNRPIPLPSAAYSEFSYSYYWALLTPLVIWLGNRFVIERKNWWKTAPVHLSAIFLMGLATKSLWLYLVLPFISPSRVPDTFWSWAAQTIYSMDFALVNYALILLCHYAWLYYRRYQEGQIRAANLEAQLAIAQLQALKMQLQPHFLFNTLHAITELVHEDPVAAERTIARLSEFLRLTLDQAGAAEVPLAQELRFMERYLEIEKVRFDDRLTVEMAVDPATLEAQVPNFILQPLVENAIKHGVSAISQEGRLRIESSRRAGSLRVAVIDNGPGAYLNGDKTVREGVGLTNTRARLERLYNGDFRMSLQNLPAGGFEVAIQIPFRASDPAICDTGDLAPRLVPTWAESVH